MPRTNVKPANTNLTPEQYDTLRQLAALAGLGLAAYLRHLIAQDAAARGIEWPEHYGRGKHPRAK